MIQNQYAVQKYMFDILKERYQDNQNIVERVGSVLVTQQDMTAWAKLVSDVFETGYMAAINQYKEQMEKMGYSFTIVPGKKA